MERVSTDRTHGHCASVAGRRFCVFRLVCDQTFKNNSSMHSTVPTKPLRKMLSVILAWTLVSPWLASAQNQTPKAESLWKAARQGDLEKVKQADPNVRDTFYSATPITWASSGNRYDIMKALVFAGASDVDSTLVKAVAQDDLETIRHITAGGKASRRTLMSTLSMAEGKQQQEAVKMIKLSLAKFYPKVKVPQGTLDCYAGTYLAKSGSRVDIHPQAGSLSVQAAGGRAFNLDADSQTDFSNELAKLQFQVTDAAVSGRNWGQFRGTGARGIGDGQQPPTVWNAEQGQNLAWKTRIPGLGHSCPVIWNDRLFVTTAISDEAAEIRIGLYGDVASVQDDSEHEFVTYCLSTETGEILWQQTACKKTPRVKRHLKSTHANSTVATDGTHVVAWFGSEGIYCYTMDGQLVWKRDLGLLDSGWFYDRDYQWQFGASPIIYSQRLILQCDIQDQSFIAMVDVATGDEVWKTNRDEIPSWATPNVVDTPAGLQIVTNATGAARGYDFETGKEIWQIKRNSEIAVPTPITARGLIYISSGYRPIQPIYAIRLDAKGDLTLDDDVHRSDYVAWSETKGGPYMPSPIVYGDYLYICSNSGILTCYQAVTEELAYKKRLPMKGSRSFVASPLAADGKLFVASEEGETAVIQAGPTFKLVANNFCGENCLTRQRSLKAQSMSEVKTTSSLSGRNSKCSALFCTSALAHDPQALKRPGVRALQGGRARLAALPFP